MKKISHYEIAEYTYDSRNERDNHCAELYLDGWREEGKIKKLKDNVSLFDATPEDYEWFARLIKFHQ